MNATYAVTGNAAQGYTVRIYPVGRKARTLPGTFPTLGAARNAARIASKSS